MLNEVLAQEVNNLQKGEESYQTVLLFRKNASIIKASELDWLIYNKPLEYAQLVLGDDLESYLKGKPEHRLMD